MSETLPLHRAMNTLGSPANIKILLHCHCDPRPLSEILPLDYSRNPRDPMRIPGVEELVRLGAIEANEHNPALFITTDLGRAWVKALCDTPIPRAAFIDALGNVITDY